MARKTIVPFNKENTGRNPVKIKEAPVYSRGQGTRASNPLNVFVSTNHSSNDFERISRITEVEYRFLYFLNSGLKAFSRKNIAHLLGFKEATIRKYITNNVALDQHKSEVALCVVDLYNKGIDTFGNIELFEKWLDYANPGLKGKKPIELLNTVTGINMIEDLLVNIQYGNLAL